MKKKKKSASGKSTRMIILFCLFVFCIIAISLIVKTAILFSQSTFDGKHQFILAVHEDRLHTIFLAFSPDKRSLVTLSVVDISQQNLRSVLGIAFDAEIDLAGKHITTPQQVLAYLFFHLYTYPHKHINIVDVGKLYAFAHSLTPDAISYREITQKTSEVQKETIVQFAFVDHTIYQEGVSIGVVNAADTVGLGTKLAKFLQNIGGNVVSVTTADSPKSTSSITYAGDKPSYTVIRLAKILGYPLKPMKNPTISDIIVTIGKDYTSYPGF